MLTFLLSYFVSQMLSLACTLTAQVRHRTASHNTRFPLHVMLLICKIGFKTRMVILLTKRIWANVTEKEKQRIGKMMNDE